MKQLFYSVLLVSLTGVLFPGAVLSYSDVRPSSLTPASHRWQLTQTNQSRAISEQLYGLWEAREPESGQLGRFLFTSDGQMYIYEVDSSSVYKAEYRINTNTEPMQLDLLFEGDLILTIFALTETGQLQLETQEIYPNNFRPTAFINPVTFDRLGDGVGERKEYEELIAIEQAHREATETLWYLNTLQIDYYSANNKFATAIADLDGELPQETENYRYQLDIGDNDRSVLLTGTAKQANLKSYTVLLFIDNFDSERGEHAFNSTTCVTEDPSMTAPGRPLVIPRENPTLEPSEIQCPEGSEYLYGF
jgi:hypothetical protein